eukprot:355058-Chlamydomonas_euryale.AAC.5
MISAAASKTLHRAPLTRPGPGLTAHPGNQSHTRKGCTTLATPATASARPCHMSILLGLLKFHRSKVFNSVPPGLPLHVPSLLLGSLARGSI